MPYRKIKSSVTIGKFYLEVDGFYCYATSGDETTAPTKASFDVEKIIYRDVDIHDLLVELGYDTTKIEQMILDKL